LYPDPDLIAQYKHDKVASNYLEDDLLVGDNVKDILSHTIVDKGSNGSELLLAQLLSILCPDQVGLTALDPLDMTVQIAHLGDIGGLGRPWRDGADTGQDNKKVESFSG
jgi:hypothetical protein